MLDARAALVLFGAIAAFYFVGAAGVAPRTAWAVAAVEWVLMGLPCLLVAAKLGPSSLGLRRPTARQVLGAVMIGASMWMVLAGVVVRAQEWFAPTPPEVIRAIERVAVSDTPWVPLFAVAFTPAVCEELLCRGLLLPPVARRAGIWPAALVSALAFALLHVSPSRLVPMFFLGCSLGVVAHAAGTWASMIVHFLNNAAVVLLASLGGLGWIEAHANELTGAAVALAAAGHYVVLKK